MRATLGLKMTLVASVSCVPCALVSVLSSLALASIALGQIAPTPLNYAPLAFDPPKWHERKVSLEMTAWHGKKIVLVTRTAELDKDKMESFVDRLDGGWETYQSLVGKSPQLFRNVDGKATICALPQPDLSCGYGCGYVGSTGIEVAGFYAHDWPAFQANEKRFEHYYFYEMGRNFYVYGDRHSLFTTGYAVFMRYVCMDRLECEDADLATRKVIERCEQVFADSELPFLDAFTNLSAGEKGHRLTDPTTGQAITPSDQPVMYASAMMKLRRDLGGDRWVKAFLHKLHECPAVPASDERTAMQQSLNWLVCASSAAEKDLSGVFVDRWRMPLNDRQRAIMSTVDWSNDDLAVARVIEKLATESP